MFRYTFSGSVLQSTLVRANPAVSFKVHPVSGPHLSESMPQFGKLGIDFGEKRAENCFKGSENLKLISLLGILLGPFLG